MTFPAGAVTSNITFRIAVDSAGAPVHVAALDAELATPVSNTYAITPHEQKLIQPATVSLPFDTSKVQPGDQLVIVKGSPGEDWEIYPDVRRNGDRVEGEFSSFSFFYVATLRTVAPATGTTRSGPFSFRLTGLPYSGSDPYRSVHYEVSGSQPVCTGGSGYTTTLAYTTDYTFSTDPFWTGGDADYRGAVMTPMLYPYWEWNHASFAVAPSVVAASPNSFAGEFLQGVSKPDQMSGPTTAELIVGMEIVLIRAKLTCLLSTGKEVIINGANPGQLPWRHAELNYDPYRPAEAVAVLADELSAFVQSGQSPQASVTIVTGYTERKPEAGVYWDMSTDQGASWEQIGFVPSTSAVADTRFPSGGAPPPLKYSLGLPAVNARINGAQVRMRYCTSPVALACAPATAGLTRGIVHTLSIGVATAPPGFAQMPHSVLVRTGETASFSVLANGLPIPTLQWQRLAPNATATWADIAGATSANYTTGALALADTGTQYRVRATNSGGEDFSLPATASVSDTVFAPSISSQPLSLSVIAGSEAVFAVDAQGTEALSYQWSFNGAPIQGANAPMLKLPAVTAVDAGAYTVTVSNLVGTVTSASAELIVSGGTTVSPVAPSIATQPADVTVNSGNTATFAVGAGGSGPLTFQWRRNGVNISGADSAAYTINSVALLHAGSYSVVITNSAGSVTSNAAILDVVTASASTPPVITTQPSTLVVMRSSMAILAVAASGSGPLSYQWSLNDVPISGATSAVLRISEVTPDDAGNYTVRVTNAAGSVTSNVAELILVGAPVINVDPENVSVAENLPAIFSVSANGQALRYQWLRNGVTISGATGGTYTIAATSLADNGAAYSVIVYNAAGLVISQPAILTVQNIAPPTVLMQPANTTIDSGSAVSLCAAFGGGAPFAVALQRWSGSAWSTGTTGTFTDNNQHCLSTGNLVVADNGAQFRLTANNPVGQVVSNAVTITVTAAPFPGISQTTLVSMTLAGGPGDYGSTAPSVSADGRYVAFLSSDWNLVAGFPNSPSVGQHAYLRDLATGTTTLIDRPLLGGMPSNRSVSGVKLSSNGRYAVFATDAGDLVEGDTNNMLDVFRRDLLTGTTIRLSTLPNGNQLEGGGGGGYDARLSVSGDGRWVTFMSPYDVSGDGSQTGGYLMYVRDVQSGYTRHFGGAAGEPPIGYVQVSDDGEWIAYAPAIVPPAPQTINLFDIEAHESREIYRFEQSSTAWLGQGISVSADGRYVAFSLRSAAVTGTSAYEVMVADRLNPGGAVLVSTGTFGVGDSNWPQISGDGRYVLFATTAPNLTAGQGASFRPYLARRDLVGGVTTTAGYLANGAYAPLNTSGGFDGGRTHALSRDGATIAFVTGDSQVYAEPRH